MTKLLALVVLLTLTACSARNHCFLSFCSSDSPRYYKEFDMYSPHATLQRFMGEGIEIYIHSINDHVIENETSAPEETDIEPGKSNLILTVVIDKPEKQAEILIQMDAEFKQDHVYSIKANYFNGSAFVWIQDLDGRRVTEVVPAF